MARRAWMAALLVFIGATTAGAADLTKVERRLVKEPAYKSGSPRYALLVFGPDARDRVWIVKDGDTLYVDRNGNGDLTDPGEKVTAAKGSGENGLRFEAGDLNVGGKTHHRLNVGFMPLKKLMMADQFAQRLDMKAALAKDPAAEMMMIALDAIAPHLKAKGQVTIAAGPVDVNGPLVLATKPADAPIIHFGGPLAVSFCVDVPSFRRERAADCILALGTPGLGSGTFAMIGYEGVIPDSVYPKVEVTYAPAKGGAPPVKALYELKQRC